VDIVEIKMDLGGLPGSAILENGRRLIVGHRPDEHKIEIIFSAANPDNSSGVNDSNVISSALSSIAISTISIRLLSPKTMFSTLPM